MKCSRLLSFSLLLLIGALPAAAQRGRTARDSARPAKPPAKIVYFTFGNHMHWVDMTWNWGEQVLPSSAEDMMRLVDLTGAFETAITSSSKTAWQRSSTCRPGVAKQNPIR